MLLFRGAPRAPVPPKGAARAPVPPNAPPHLARPRVLRLCGAVLIRQVVRRAPRLLALVRRLPWKLQARLGWRSRVGVRGSGPGVTSPRHQGEASEQRSALPAAGKPRSDPGQPGQTRASSRDLRSSASCRLSASSRAAASRASFSLSPASCAVRARPRHAINEHAPRQPPLPLLRLQSRGARRRCAAHTARLPPLHV